MTREALLARTLVDLADSLVDEFDVVDLLTTLTDRCVELFQVDAAGIMLVSPEGGLRLMTSSSETMRLVELYELQAQQGPCLDCYNEGQPIASGDLSDNVARWPLFAPVALAAGFHSVDAIPMRLRRNVIGALNVFHTGNASLAAGDIVAAQALADVATIAILQHHASVSALALNDQLNQALNSRILIEQAKGVIAEREQVDMDGAFTRLRNYARNHNRRLVEVASDIIDGSLSSHALERPRKPR
jgi:GAF domain-containing protein